MEGYATPSYCGDDSDADGVAVYLVLYSPFLCEWELGCSAYRKWELFVAFACSNVWAFRKRREESLVDFIFGCSGGRFGSLLSIRCLSGSFCWDFAAVIGQSLWSLRHIDFWKGKEDDGCKSVYWLCTFVRRASLVSLRESCRNRISDSFQLFRLCYDLVFGMCFGNGICSLV